MLVQAGLGFLKTQVATPKGIGAVTTAAAALFFGAQPTIEYVRGVIWPPELHAAVRLGPETLEIRAWNTGARVDELRNVALSATQYGATILFAPEAIDWAEPERFVVEGLPVPPDGHESEFERALGRAAPTAAFYDLDEPCRFHVTATFNRKPVRIPETGDCACDARQLCRL